MLFIFSSRYRQWPPSKKAISELIFYAILLLIIYAAGKLISQMQSLKHNHPDDEKMPSLPKPPDIENAVHAFLVFIALTYLLFMIAFCVSRFLRLCICQN